MDLGPEDVLQWAVISIEKSNSQDVEQLTEVLCQGVELGRALEVIPS